MQTLPDTLQRGSSRGWDRVLFEQLRVTPMRPEAKRVEQILILLVEADALAKELSKPHPTDSISQFLGHREKRNLSERAYTATLARLNKALVRYHWTSEIVSYGDHFREELRSSSRVRPGYQAWEYAVVRLLLISTSTPGEIGRFRRCSDCNNWLFATTSHQKFCGDVCRRHNVSTSDEFKKKRRVYMQQVYRPQLKERDDRMKQLATGKQRRAKKDGKI